MNRKRLSLICGLVFLCFWGVVNAAGQDTIGKDASGKDTSGVPAGSVLADGTGTGIHTNAGSGLSVPGAFTSEKWFWFSVHPRGALRLVLDGVEIYRGPGPGMVFLNVNPGEERRFEITAERYAAGDGGFASGPRETRVFAVHLDKRAALSRAPGSSAGALRTSETGTAVFIPETGSGADVYVASSPAPDQVSPESPAVNTGSGTREDPFIYLDDAVNFARRTGRTSIRLRGRVRLRGDLAILGNLAVYGAPGPGEHDAVLEIPGDFSIRIHRGILRLQGLVLDRKSAPAPAFYLGTGAGFELADSVFKGEGPLVWVEEKGVCLITGSLIASLMKENRRIPVFSAGKGEIHLRQSCGNLDGVHGLFFGMKGGIFSAEDSFFRLEAERSGTLLNFEGVRADIANLNAYVSAGDYGSLMEISGSRMVMTGGSLSVSARDGLIVLAEASETLFSGTGFFLSSAFVARAMELSGRFPLVSGCYFSFTGFARQAEVFSVRLPQPASGTGASPLRPAPGAVAGSIFKGFTRILGGEFPVSGLSAFNRAFAPPDRPNTAE
ncbi:MAG: hypothetical protein LBO80_10115 [Treponema sp.]|jgi:hypothetical protein|nr:hypothetical protein [Treponema sp.]